MTIAALCSFCAVINLLCFLFHSHPDGWDALMDIEMERGLSHDEARMRNGWWRLGSLIVAVINGLLGYLA